MSNHDGMREEQPAKSDELRVQRRIEARISIDQNYWEMRTRETDAGVMVYGASKPEAGAAAEIGYVMGEKTMDDRALVDAEFGIYGVFDGIGKTKGAACAATIAAETIHDVMLKHTDIPPADRLRHALASANEHIVAYQMKARVDAGTTAAVAYITPSQQDGTRVAYVASVGDSRVYLCRRDGQIYQLTEDDRSARVRNWSEVAEQRAEGKNILSNSLGVDEVQGENWEDALLIQKVTLSPDEFVVFTTDGVHDPLAAHDRDMHALDRHVTREIGDILRTLFTEYTAQDVQAWMNDVQQMDERKIRFLRGTSLAIHDRFSTLSLGVASRWREAEQTLYDAIGDGLSTNDAGAIAKRILATVHQVNDKRREHGDHERAKTDNRAVVVAGLLSATRTKT